MNDTTAVLAFVVVLVCSLAAPSSAAATVDTTEQDRRATPDDHYSLDDDPASSRTTPTASAAQSTQQSPPDDDVDYENISDRLRALASVGPDANVTISDEREAAARAGALAGVEIAQQQGVNVTQEQRQAAVNASIRAAAQEQNATVEQLQFAAQGAAHGALLQSQRANVTQVQAGVYGATAGALSQFQQANVSQLQSAAYGAAHGVVAQHQFANVTQLQFASVGAAAGAAQSVNQSQAVVVTQIQEAAQGGAYGSLVQRQNVTVTQIQAAAYGAAGGGAASANDTDPKKTQEAAMGAARGSLVQRQNVTVTQIQAAARGASGGALFQSQNVTVTQIQEAALGAAHGALTQTQSATVRQIQAASFGAANGVLTQVQIVDIVQIQQAAFGAARGATRTAAQQQTVNVTQIQAAAAGAGQGTIIQIQQINIVQIQIIADSAASGALSQFQTASVNQIQSAAAGASEGALLLVQRQEIQLEQLQQRTQRAAADTAGIAAQINVINQVTINIYARSAVTTPQQEPEPDEPERLRSLFAATDEETLFLANPNDIAVTVTVTTDDGRLATITLAPGESVTRQLDSGRYTLTAETGDGRTVRLAGRSRLQISVGDDLRSLSAIVDDQRLVVQNPNDQRVTVVVTRNGNTVATFDVPREFTVRQRLDPGTYTVRAVAEDGRRVPVNGNDRATVTVEPNRIDLNASLDDRTLTVENPGDRTVRVTVSSAAGERTIEVGPGDTATATLTPTEPVGHVVTGAAPGREVLVNGLPSYTFFVPVPPEIDLDVIVDGQTLAIENPSDTDVIVTAAPDSGSNQTITVPAARRVTATLDPGTYTLAGDSGDERPVLINGQSSLAIEIEPPEPVPLSVSVEEQSVSIENPTDTDTTVTAAPADGENQTFAVPAGETVTRPLDPGNYTLTGAAENDRPVLLNGQAGLAIEIEPPEPVALSVAVEEQRVSIENPSDQGVTVTASAADGGDQTILVPAGETVSRSLDPGNYTLTGVADGQRPVLLNDRSALEIEIEPPEPVNLTVSVAAQNVTVENPSDTDVTVTAALADGANQTITVPAGENRTASLEPGNYTLTGDADDERPVRLNGESQLQITIEEPTLEPVDLTVSVADQNVTVENPGGVNVTVTAAPADGANQTILVPAGETVTRTLEPGTYTLTGAAEDERSVRLNGESQLQIEIQEPALEPANLSVTVEGENVTIQNPSGAGVSVQAVSDSTNRTLTVPATTTVTERFAPGNYTLTGESDDGRPVTFDGERQRTIEVLAPAIDQTIDSCQNITAPGRYVVTDDIESASDGSCLQVQTGNVTVDGNGSWINGTGPVDDLDPAAANAGILVHNETGPRIENVTVRNVNTSGWNAGLQVNNSESGGPTDVVIENVTTRDNDAGLTLGGGDARVDNVTAEANALGVGLAATNNSTLTNLTVNDSDAGVTAVESSSVALNSSSVNNSTDVGVLVGAATSLSIEDSVVADNDGVGVQLRGDNGSTLDNATVAGNGAEGVLAASAREGSVVTRSRIVDNDGVGLRATSPVTTEINDTVVEGNRDGAINVSGNATVENVSLLDNEGITFDSRQGNANATDLRFGPSTTAIGFDNQSLVLDPVAVGALPPLPDGATAIDAGLNVTGLDGVAQLRVTFVANEVNESVELWRQNGTAWASFATDPTPGDGAIEQSIDRNGIYALVRPLEEPLGVNSTVGNRIVWVENPTEEPLTVTLTNASGTVRSLTVAAGVNESITGLDPGEYTLTATTAEGEVVAVDDGIERQFTLPPALQSLSSAVGEDALSVENPNDVPVTLALENETGAVQQFTIGPETVGQIDFDALDAGEYTARASTADGRDVAVDGQWNTTIVVPETQTPTPTPTQTEVGTPTPTQTGVGTPTPTQTAGTTPTPTQTAGTTPTQTEVGGSTPTPTQTQTEAGALTPTQTEPGTPTQTQTETG